MKIINNNTLIKSFDSICNRGLIRDNMPVKEFTDKIQEELNELIETGDNFDREELADVVIVCLTMATYFNVDIIEEIHKKIKINIDRSGHKLITGSQRSRVNVEKRWNEWHELMDEGYSMQQIAKMYGTHASTISKGLKRLRELKEIYKRYEKTA